MTLLRSLLLCVAMTASGTALAQASKSPAQLAVHLFTSACVRSLGQMDQVEASVRRLPLTQLKEADAKRFLAGATGKVWATRDANGQFAISASEPGTCTVFVRVVDRAELKREFEVWLPPSSSSFAAQLVSTEVKDDIESLHYQIRRDGVPFASWLLLTTPGSMQGMISVRALRP